MLAESVPTANLLALACLISASAVAWWWISARRLSGRTMIPDSRLDPVVWPAAIPVLALPLSLGVQLLVSAFGMSLETEPEDLLGKLRIDCLARAGAWVCLLLLPLAVGPWRATDLGLRRGGLPADLAAGVVTTLAAFGPVLAINVLLSYAGWKDPAAMHPLLEALLAEPERVLPWVVFSAVVLAPLHEELLYRVLLQGGLESRLGPVPAIACSTFLFCAGHLAPGRPDGLALVPLALLLGWLHVRRHSYIAVVTAHALFNLINLGLALLPRAA
ncbi:MAG: CPBP family intramembrane metalloprotease [Planctomycetaceae bacterium]|nr:MAG: CPBP family intramembrane metalloprotease [Planctomycetaceae bacterium]